MGFIMKHFFLLTGLLLAGFCGPLNAAVHLSNDGIGQVAIVPFYSVANGLETHLKVINTSDQYKAVRVNVRTADLSAHPVYSLNVYLSPRDTWRLAMGQRNDFIGAITADQTCTMGLTNPADQAIDWSEYIWQTGFMEVIEMGDFDPITMGLYNHQNNLCTYIKDAWSVGGQWSNNPLKGIKPATGNIRVSTELLNVAKGYSFEIPVTLLSDFFVAGTLIHTPVGSHEPNLDSGTKNSRVFYKGEVIETTWNHGYEAVSALLMKESVTNEYNLLTPIRGHSEWIMTLPTMSFHLYSQGNKPIANKDFYYPEGQSINYRAYSSEGFDVPPPCFRFSCAWYPDIAYLSQLTSVYSLTNTLDNDNFSSNLSISTNPNTYNFHVYSYKPQFSDSEKIAAQEGVLKLNFTEKGNSGPGQLPQVSITGINTDTGLNQTFYGLPVIGFAAHFYYNDAALATYSRSQNHSATRRITESEAN